MKYTKLFVIMGFLSNLFGCGPKSANTQETTATAVPKITIPVENIAATADQKERRAQSEKICEAKGIPVYANPNALFVSAENETVLRTQDEVVDRAVALLYLGLKSEGLEQVHLDQMNTDYAVSAKLSPREKEYAFADNPTQQQRTDANWRYESLHVLLWSLGYIDELAYPDQLCNVAHDVKIVYELGPDAFREQAQLRSKREILDQADLVLCYDWACVSARVKNEDAPGGMDSSVVYERHYALNWLIKYMDQEWDNVSTDT